MSREHAGVASAVVLVIVLSGFLQPVLGAAGEKLVAHNNPAADTGKKVLTIDDYARWRSITAARISNNGAWVAFGYEKPNNFDPEMVLHVKSLINDTDYEIPEATEARFSDDSRWVAYFVDPAFEEAEELRSKNKPVPRKVQLLHLESGDRHTWNNAAWFQFAAASGFLAIKEARVDPAPEHRGTDLVLRNLQRGTDQLIGSVDQLAFNRRRDGSTAGCRLHRRHLEDVRRCGRRGGRLQPGLRLQPPMGLEPQQHAWQRRPRSLVCLLQPGPARHQPLR